MTKRLLIDCSSTITCEFNTGIQRVVRNLCEQAEYSQGEFDRAAVPVYGRKGQLYRAQSLYPQPAAPDLAARIASSPLAQRYRALAANIFQRFPHRGLEKLLLPRPGHAGIFKLPQQSLRGISRIQRSLATRPTCLKVHAGDVLLMADASWMVPNWAAIQRAKASGALVGNLIYDLIPLTHPQFFPEDLVRCFKAWFERTARSSDFFLCISDHVTAQMRQRLQQYGRSADMAQRMCRSFPLGADLTSRPSSETPSPTFEKLFSGPRRENPHLVVGTLEPRKNHAFVLDAFERLWRSGSSERLCLVGRIGWNCQATLDRVQNHSEFGHKLFLFHEASDADVRFAYRHAKSLIMASHTEGFGLPILEALDFDQTVWASATDIHREVGGDRVDYFEIDGDCDTLVQLVRQWDDLARKESLPFHSQRPRWSDSFAAIHRQLDRLSEPAMLAASHINEPTALAASPT